MSDRDTLLALLDLARWAPSGDNTQPWRFSLPGPGHVAIHGFDTRDEVLYDFDGHASQMAHGALLETLRVAATTFGYLADWQLREGSSDAAPIYDVRLTRDAGIDVDPLAGFIRSRVVQRRPMRIRRLTDAQRQALIAAVGQDFEIVSFETLGQRASVARLLWQNAALRLTCPEAYRVHRAVIEWKARFSDDRIPEQAVGVDPVTARLMRWVMHSWERVDFFNRYLFGTFAPRVQLDLLPALACSAHLLVRARRQPDTLVDHVRAGIAMQRLWLTAASLGLYLQPQMTPVIFRWYARSGRSISVRAGIDSGAAELASAFEALAGADRDAPFSFFCRVGTGRLPHARSLRKDLSSLMLDGA